MGILHGLEKNMRKVAIIELIEERQLYYFQMHPQLPRYIFELDGLRYTTDTPIRQNDPSSTSG